MSGRRDKGTRTTRLAANAAAAAVVAYAILWTATTQVRWIRESSPFGVDPWDIVATYSAIFLPVVAGSTWIRSLSHRGPRLAPETAARIRCGSGLAVGVVLASVASDLLAIAGGTSDMPSLGPGDPRPILIGLLVALAGLLAVVAAALLIRAAVVVRRSEMNPSPSPAAVEPDVIDDLLTLAAEVARPIGLGRAMDRLAAAIDRFLEASTISPRRHRILFGVVLAIASAVAFDAWETVVEGGWATPVVPVILCALSAVGVLGIYFGTLVPLRLLRPPASASPSS